MGKKLELGDFLRILTTVWTFGLVATLTSCGSSPGYSYTVGGVVSSMAGSGLQIA
jgi:hypothetical protein